MDGIISLEAKHVAQPLQHILALRTIRAHKGIWLSASNPESMRRADSNGIDLLLIIIRHLISYGYDKSFLSTAAASAVLDAAGKDLGWDEEVDWRIKGHLLGILQTPSNSPSLDKLMVSVELQSLFFTHPQFHIIQSSVFSSNNEGKTWTKSELGRHDCGMANRFIIDDNSSIPQQIYQRFSWTSSKGNSKTWYRGICTKPPFLILCLRVTKSNFDQRTLETLELELPAGQMQPGKQTWAFGMHQLRFRLCAIVLTKARGNGNGPQNEQVRLYGDSGEVILSELESRGEAIPWVVGCGLYTLFYRRICTYDGWPTAKDIEDAA
ncbi:hypothetical protein VTL71DRAFT_9406 [Oculimacula yallundae]|uniref:Uncharacterized protein n=1 Tax=Oculimacula yallundae TaxID=86028 RepID=A0ABR4BSY5_9HELO